MTSDDLRELLRACPLVASVQASDGSAVDDPATLLRLAQASIAQGVKVLRLQGAANIKAIKKVLDVPVIGLVKRKYPDSEVYITATAWEVGELLDLGCEIIALDATERTRPGNESLANLIGLIHAEGALAMADCDTAESAQAAIKAGADLVGTTLAGYTGARSATDGPDLELLRSIQVDVPVIAEGRYAARWQVEAALRIGATGVVVGGALNDPVKQTRALMPRSGLKENVGAVDIGGTWLRFAVFGPDWTPHQIERQANPPKREERLGWIREMIAKYGVTRLGVGTGGIIDPRDGICWTAKEYLMPDQIGIEFSERTLGVPTFAYGDGHATAWGHACLPQFAGRRVATLALGTGVGCGFVESGRIWAGRRGEYPRINDLPSASGASYEALLGGLHLTTTPTDEQRTNAITALEGALYAVKNMYFPDDVVVGGSVGLSDWLRPYLDDFGAIPSPFELDAGIYGAAALALFPPEI